MQDTLNSHQDLPALLAAQRHAFVAEPAPSLGQRKVRLATLRKAVLAYRARFQAAISADFSHRSAFETDIMELMGVVQAIDYLSKKLRRFMKPQRRHVGLYYQSGKAYVSYQPLGVVGIMAPWNYPLSLTLIPLATALAAGNRAMVKPSELTPRTSALLQEMLAASFPKEEVAVVLGGPELGADFSRLPFDHLFFTGSTAVGRKIMQSASDNLVPLTLELGGKSPALVAPGYAKAEAAAHIAYGKLANGGQTCVAPDYALVHEDERDAFIAHYQQAVARLYPKGPDSDDYTAIVNQRHFDRLNSLIDDARRQGAEVLTLGNRAAKPRDRTLAPTLILGATAQMAVMQEEIFGPVLPVLTYRTLEEAIDFINARPRPLALYYFGATDQQCAAVLARTTSGNVGINNTLLHVVQDDLPFGGVGPSGMGAYHGIEGFRAMSHGKGVFIQGRWALPKLLRAPFGKLAKWTMTLMLRP
ncbi:coniferyl aldehyde dehydrogenase [Gallaecimonas pentaromativorans]|uniref:Aldehyde dehydrogenase n=1 Tax=Gallaecimonas pentaromativorans TaxID=584787 RepID=A0A3N1P382_9GAMM|nr:coniferyl aldehyde dehydrogenase [Gallaecimonas pentaromativorans]ROQ25792.1 coniferyl-aldehyde dehydrogenase [Gallaecimonas pentaromativorans]